MTSASLLQRRPDAIDGDDARRFDVVSVTTADELAVHRAEWDALAAHALVPNVFYEPLMLLPALRHLRGAADVRVLLVWAHRPRRPTAPPVLAALVPYERRRDWRGLPMATARLWQYAHCYGCAPLLHRGMAVAALAAAVEHLATDHSLLELADAPGEGPFQHVFVETLRARGAPAGVLARGLRARLDPDADAGAGALSGRRRKELRRQERRLADQGTWTYDALGDGDDATVWLDEFLRLEAKGWKGRAGTALDATPADRAFFAAVAVEARALDRLHMLALRLSGRPVAMKVSLLCGDGAFAFKIAYDEEFARFSPGVLLEIENLSRVHAAGLRWFDSCASPDHPMIDRLWSGRMTLETLLVGLSRRGEAIAAAAPLLLWAGRVAKRLVRAVRR